MQHKNQQKFDFFFPVGDCFYFIQTVSRNVTVRIFFLNNYFQGKFLKIIAEIKFELVLTFFVKITMRDYLSDMKQKQDLSHCSCYLGCFQASTILSSCALSFLVDNMKIE